MKIFFILLLLLFSKNLFPSTLFETKFYDISFNSNNIDEDKKQQIIKIKFESIETIFKDVLMKKDYHNLKKNLNEDLINTFIKSININNEKIINTNYYSNIKINYDKFKIIKYFRNNNINYIEYIPKNIFLLIYENNQIDKNLFSNNNSYYNFLKKNPNFVFFKTPNLDINDRFLLSIEDLENKNIKKINKFLNKYLQSNAVIIISEKKDNINYYTVYLYNDNKFELIDIFKIKNKNHQVLFNKLEPLVIDKWKSFNSIDNSLFNKIECEISYYNIYELKKIKSYIFNVSSVDKIILKEISYKNNKYEINFYGDLKHFIKLIKLNDLFIKYKNNLCKINLK